MSNGTFEKFGKKLDDLLTETRAKVEEQLPDLVEDWKARQQELEKDYNKIKNEGPKKVKAWEKEVQERAETLRREIKAILNKVNK